MTPESGRAMSYGQLRRLSARSAGAAHSRPAEAAHDTWWECAAGPLRIGLVEMAMGMLTALRPREGKDGSGSDAAEELVSALDKPVELCEEQHALIPETLEYEALRMLQSAEALRRCVCLAAALLAAKQARAALRKPALPAEAMGAAASRAMALLRGPAAGADSGVVLEDVARELALAVDENESGTSTGMIARLLSHHLAGGAIAKRCVDAVRAAARAVLALGPVAGMEAACCALASVGASTAEGAVLAEEVGVAAAQLESIARVQLAVHGRTYASLLAAEDIAASEGSESEGEM
uniref:Uncharacterized protein n=1 Tax=Prasinoderma coloniale TaxID=156133 RepID=A0A7R9XXW7_9VIRI|mmetsp:Transcript_14502/g.60504  ORF Transcript_14502/g.60504 Transcript_14502/m.60504 type:complete len:295 (+) Transcript_14502:3-887(+)